MPAKRPRRNWSIEEKIGILAKASTLTGAELLDFLQREGVLQAEYEQWRLALSEEGRASLATTKRIRTLERELARKEKALAEAAALLVLKKKVVTAAASMKIEAGLSNTLFPGICETCVCTGVSRSSGEGRSG